MVKDRIDLVEVKLEQECRRAFVVDFNTRQAFISRRNFCVKGNHTIIRHPTGTIL